jgi:arginine:pyruvate transaminase
MRASTRISTLHGDGDSGWDIYFRALEMREQGRTVTVLCIGDHDWTTPESLIAVMAASARGGNTGYGHIPGSPALRRAIAARVTARSGVPTGPENVLVTGGGQGALFHALMAVLDPGDRCLMIDPHYATYPGTIRAVSGVPVAVPARPEHGFHPQLSDILAAAPGARALLVNSPHNPTGAVYSAKTWDSIRQAVLDHDLWLISDEVYDGQVWDGTHVSPRSLPDLAERTIAIGSLSKSHVMTGWRVGWAVGPADLIAHMSDLSISTTYGIPGFVQDAALAALTTGEAIERDTTATYRRRRALCMAALAGANGIGVVAGSGAMYLMLDIRRTGLSGPAFARSLLEDTGIAVLPGESFGSAAAGHIRVALTRPDDELAEAVATIAAYAAERIP